MYHIVVAWTLKGAQYRQLHGTVVAKSLASGQQDKQKNYKNNANFRFNI